MEVPAGFALAGADFMEEAVVFTEALAGRMVGLADMAAVGTVNLGVGSFAKLLWPPTRAV